jgi:hypothetical protein
LGGAFGNFLPRTTMLGSIFNLKNLIMISLKTPKNGFSKNLSSNVISSWVLMVTWGFGLPGIPNQLPAQ